MPHQCTDCGHTFADGSKEMLSGCPECGGTKFQYYPDEVPDEPSGESPPEEDAGVADAVGRAADTVRDLVGGDDRPGDAGVSGASAGSDRTMAGSDTEDTAQADARREVVDADELPDPADSGAGAGAGAGAESESESEREGAVADSPDLSELREELNSQFESIRIVEPGQYELNLMELYDRDEYIIALQENGRYVIEVPDAWRDDSPAGEG